MSLNAQDRRNIPLKLTGSGNQLLDNNSEKNRGWRKSQMTCLSSQDLETLACAMKIIARTFDGPVGELSTVFKTSWT